VPPQVRRGELWADHMRLKRVAIGNTLGDILGTSWEPIGNLKGTKGKKILPHPPTYKKKIEAL